MTTLKAEKRDMNVKAKKLRREGFVTGVLFGHDRKESLPLVFTEKDATRLIKESREGAQVILELGTEKISAIVKNIDYDPLQKQILALDFQELVAGEKISTTVPIRLLNESILQDRIVEQEMEELHYKADPAHLVDHVDIDFQNFTDARNILVKDLAIASNPDIELITPADAIVIHIAEHQAEPEEETAAEEN